MGLNRRTLALAAAATALASAARSEPAPLEVEAERYRPVIHFAPPGGFMNDPNGLIHHDGEWHLFYQYNPFEPKSGRVYWGHAVSRDLLHWQGLPLVLDETPAGAPFSGSAVFDAHNTSGLFAPGQPGLVAVYTRASPGHQRQEIALSADRGRSFTGYAGNPVLDRGTNSFRDPKVFWHAPARRWLMAVAASRERQVLFYASADLKRWQEVGRFGDASVSGNDWECPNLVRLPVEGGGMRWVLFVSVGPDASQDGGAVRYFVGEFDGRHFTADDAAARFADFGPDFYAMQTYSDPPGDKPVAIAWASNWLYCNDVPTGSWRGVMSLPRLLSLRRSRDGWRLVQGFVPLGPIRGAMIPATMRAGLSGRLATAALPPGAAIELQVRLRLDARAVAALRFVNGVGEALVLGYDQDAARLFVDRGGAHGFANPLFTSTFATARRPGARDVDLHLVLDRCTLEVIGLQGEAAGTFLHFFAKMPDRLVIEATGSVQISFFELRRLVAAPH